jgi:hypothetical protein
MIILLYNTQLQIFLANNKQCLLENIPTTHIHDFLK